MRPKCGPYRTPRHEVTQPLDQSYRLIPLTQGQNTLVDVEDYDWLRHWNWHARWNPHTKSFYAMTYNGIKKVSMHTQILGCGSTQMGDHINGNSLDNRRHNLRKCTNAQNTRNSGKRAHNSSGYKGVVWDKDAEKWRGFIGVDSRVIHLGYFFSREETAQAYDEAAKRYHGEFAKLNFPQN